MSTTATLKSSPVKGLRILRMANILSIIAVVLAIVGGIVLMIGAGVGLATQDNGEISTGAVATAGIGGIVAILGGLLVVASGIMQLVGLAKTTGAHVGYRNAMIVVLANIVITILSAFLPTSTVMNTILTIVGSIISLLVVFLIISATASLLRGKGVGAEAAKGIKVRTIYVVCTSIVVVTKLMEFCPFLAPATGLITVIGSVVQFVGLFMYIGFLGRAATALDA